MPTSTESSSRNREKHIRTRRLFTLLALSFGVGLVALALYSLNRDLARDPGSASTHGGPRFLGIYGSLLMASFAALGTGGLVGFLFGVPRYKTERSGSTSGPAQTPPGAQVTENYKPNTNLEEISDWLTKLFVGATLVELGKVPDLLVRFGAYFSPAPNDQHFVVSAAIYFAILGFFVAFFYASLELTETLNMPSTLQTTFTTRAPLAEISTVETLSGKEGAALDQARSALGETISGANIPANVEPKEVDFAVGELSKLSGRYEAIRQEMGPGDARTVKMEGIVAQMRLVAPAALPELAQFQSSVIAGERLACVVMLQLQPQAECLKWLVDRFRVERPFVQYHAALALRSAARQLKGQTPRVKEAVKTAMEILQATVGEAPGAPGGITSDRMRLLLQIEEELNRP